MSTRYEKLKELLRELFQLDQPDLDFGIYRVLHAKSTEVSQFLEKELLPQVQAAFTQYQSADKAELEKELRKAMDQARELQVDPETSQKVKELRAKLATDAVDVQSLEAEVYDHLYSFFRRYYSDGDYLAKRVYKPGVYAIPYEGEEVTLHWANKDQYYIKTSEYLRDYAFRLHPDSETNPMRVHFRLVDAAEGEHGNVKVAEGKERRFKLAADQPLLIEDGELVIRFTYLSDACKQAELNAEAEAAVLGNSDTAFAEWVAALKALAPTEKDLKRTMLAKHLKGYSDRNTFDYFIHKDLGGFLRRELDFYIKNEVMHLDDVENETAPRVEQYLSKIKVVRRIAGKIIDFLAQLEDFQKKLWLKKKFVVETSYCIRLGVIPEEFYPEIAANKAQRNEWEILCAIDEIAGDLVTPAYTVPLTTDFLKANASLVVDTRHFESSFSIRLIDYFGELDEQSDGVLFHSDNFQSLSLMQSRYRAQLQCVYIDPPYNTGGDGFAYKDSYQHSSWASMMMDRAYAVLPLLDAHSGSLFASIDDGEQALLMRMFSTIFGPENFVGNIIWQKKYAPANDAKWFSDDHDFVLSFARSREHWRPTRLPRNEAQDAMYSNPDDDPRGRWKADNYKSNKSAMERPNLYYAITNPTTRQEVWPNRNAVWRYTGVQHEKNEREERVWWGRDGTNAVPAYKRFLSDVGDVVPRTLWKHEEVGHNQDGIRQLRDLLPDTQFTSPKPPGLIERVVRIAAGQLTLDFFAGSGTTGHAVINLNREDGGRRKFILVEMGDYFDTVLLPRIKKVTYSPEWKDGKPKRLATAEEAERSPRIVKVVRLESYEDALNNLETHRSDNQQRLLDAPEAQGADGLKEQYILRYMLNVETRGSQSLLNVQAFTDPTAYKLKVKRPGSDESRNVNVDLLETFNWLIGLRVHHLAAPLPYNAAFERDNEGRLQLKDSLLKKEATGLFWFRAVTGTTPDGRKALVIWRKLSDDPEQDNLVLDVWFNEQGYLATDSDFDVVWVNGSCNLENIKTSEHRWKVRLIEEDFHRLMFEGAEN